MRRGHVDDAELAALTAVLLARAARIAAADRTATEGPRRLDYRTNHQPLNAQSELGRQPNSWRSRGRSHAVKIRAK
ncbi:acyl-CoA carboxylase epsilon subunit [Streptomyces sp. NPDC051172]|uniref:acyl-CoA carboxylase epsilon subunit n=1 Tax=Streptomyces sp. NPDC051172 TaxID=3155796 RepID=UPI003423BFC0